MNFDQFRVQPGEQPLDRLPSDGGFCAIFRTIGCIGDSLSSGEFESTDEKGTRDFHDFYEYSWGQYIARMTGSKVYNFSRGGMSAKWYWDTYADENDFWNPDKLCQAYIIALGVNDLHSDIEIGSTADVCPEDWNRNAETFAGYYARIIQRLKSMQPQARFFLMTMPRKDNEEEAYIGKCDRHAALLHDFAALFDYTYVIDLRKYAPVYDERFRRNFYLGGHLNPMGYMLTAKMTAAYIDYIIRSAPEDFAQVGFIGCPFHNMQAKW